MTVDSVNIINFRNIPSLNLIPSDGVNVIYGENAQGKTNILESIWLFTGCKSFRGSKDADFIKFGEDFSKTEITFSNKIRQKKAEITINEKKKITLNGIELKTPSELIGEFYAVIFSPSHLSLIKDGPFERRRFLDTALCQLKPKYAECLKAYKHSLLQRNSILKDVHINSELYDVLDSWDISLAKYASVIISERIKYVSLLSLYCSEIYSGISENLEKFSIYYDSSADIKECKNTEEIYEVMLRELKSKRKEDIIFKTTSSGPHRDDLNILINEKSARNFGSQGQQRSGALALKLGEAEITEKITGETPVALLDDVMSELDEKRQDYILNRIKERQVFLTCCDPSQVMRMCNGKSFLIKKGNIIK